MKYIQFIDKYWLGFIALVAVAAYALIMSIGALQPIWFDEGYSILLAKSSFADLWSLTSVDAHPPLFYLLLKVWGSVFGFGEFALRSMSAVAMSGAIVVGLSLLRRVFSTKAALVAVPFLLFAPFLLRYGYEIRMYAVATLIAISATYVLVQARTTGKRWLWVLYAVLVAAGMYTLYLMAAVWVAHVVWLLIESIRAKEKPFWKWTWLYAFVGAVVLYLPYIPTFIHQFTNSALPGIGSSITITKLGDIVSMLTIYTPEWSLSGLLSIPLLVLLVGVIILAGVVYRVLPVVQLCIYQLLLILAIVPVIFFAITSLPPANPIFIIRYMAHVSIFVYLFAAATVALAFVYRTEIHRQVLKKWSLRRVNVSIAVVAGLLLVSGIYGTAVLAKTGNLNFERMQQPRTTDVRQQITCDDTTTIVADDPYTFIDSVYYFDGCDLRFYAAEDPAYKGGYAMLHGSDKRIASPSELDTSTVYHLRWTGQDGSFVFDDRYRLTQSHTFDKQVVDRYELILE